MKSVDESRRQRIRILLLDYHALFRESAAHLLATEAGFEVVGCATVDEAMAILHRKQIDIVLLVFYRGEENGVQFIRLAKDQGFKGKILVVTAGVEESKAAEMIYMGISGIFMTHNSPALLAQAIRDVIAGRVWLDQQLFEPAIKIIPKSFSEPRKAPFTERQRQVLSYVLKGMSNREIAVRIGVSENSVKATLQQLFLKTGVHTRSQLVRITLEQHKNEL
jgi:DNA-binding NarL/FixJ family response regulator